MSDRSPGPPADRLMRVLVVVAEPDERDSTELLRGLVKALDRHPNVEVEVWFLRVIDLPSWRPGARDVDRLRTSPLGRFGSVLGETVSSVIRGRRLRRWFQTFPPDVVVLDDGLGERLLSACPTDPVVVVRRNPDAPVRPTMEPPPRTDGDVVLWSEGDPGGPGPDHWLRMPPLLAVRRFAMVPPPPPPGSVPDPEAPGPRPGGRTLAQRAEEARPLLRSRLGLLDGQDLVVGWGDDGWLDGPDLLVRSLWFLEHRHGRRVHGAWLGLAGSDDVQERLRGEAEQCGVADRFHVVTDAEEGLQWGADALFLPYREPIEAEVLLDAGGAGVDVVTFPPVMLEAPWVHEVSLFDVEGAAAALDIALGRDRTELQRDLDVALWVETFVGRLRLAMSR